MILRSSSLGVDAMNSTTSFMSGSRSAGFGKVRHTSIATPAAYATARLQSTTSTTVVLVSPLRRLPLLSDLHALYEWCDVTEPSQERQGAISPADRPTSLNQKVLHAADLHRPRAGCNDLPESRVTAATAGVSHQAATLCFFSWINGKTIRRTTSSVRSAPSPQGRLFPKGGTFRSRDLPHRP